MLGFWAKEPIRLLLGTAAVGSVRIIVRGFGAVASGVIAKDCVAVCTPYQRGVEVLNAGWG